MEQNQNIDINEIFEKEINTFNLSWNSLNDSKNILEEFSSFIQKYLDIINTYYMSLTELKASFPKSYISQNDLEEDDIMKKISLFFISFIESQLNNLLLFLSNTQTILFSLKQIISNSKIILDKTKEKNKNIFSNIKILNDKYYKEYTLMINSFETLENKIVKKYIKTKYSQIKENDDDTVDNENSIKNCVTISKNIEKQFLNFKIDEIIQYIYEYNNNMEEIINNKLLYNKEFNNCIMNIINCFNEYFANSINNIQKTLSEKEVFLNTDLNENDLNYNINEKEINSIIYKIFNSKKYNIKILKDNLIILNDEKDKSIIKNKKNNLKKPQKIFLSEEDKFNIIKEIYNYDFKSISKEEYDLDKEQEKLRIYNLAKKLLSYDKKKDKKESINEDEIKILYNLLKINNNNYDNISYFLLQLYQFRADGKLEMPQRVFNIINKIIENCLNEILNEENNYYLKIISSIIIISCTFYIIKNKKKYYLKDNLKEHQIFKSTDLWVDYTVMQIEEDLKKTQNERDINGEKINNKKINDILLSKILPSAVTMTKFEIDKDNIFKAIDILMNKYEMDEKSKKLLLKIINQQE